MRESLCQSELQIKFVSTLSTFIFKKRILLWLKDMKKIMAMSMK